MYPIFEIFLIDFEALHKEISDFWKTINLSELKLKASSIYITEEEISLFRNFIEGMELLNQFLVDCEEDTEKNIVLERFMDDYSKINTFRKVMESIQLRDSLNKIEDHIEKIISSEENYTENFHKIVEEVKRND